MSGHSSWWRSLVLVGLPLLMPACPPPGAPDAAVRDAVASDGAARDSALAEGGRIDSGPCVVDSRGFCIRTPQTRSVPLDLGGMPGVDASGATMDVMDIDYVCTLDYQALHAFVYVQSRATSCRDWGGCEMTVDGAWISIGGAVSAITASYDWGGNHRNDSITVNHDAKVFRYYHSSIGYGWRSCHEPDCTQVFQSDGTTSIEDGCTMARTLPQVCKLVDANGHVDELIDEFAPCPGDPNYQDAGSGG